MLGDCRRQVTYFGTLDDVVERYPWPNPLDLRSIRQQLVTSAIYGKRILINDGYLVANPLLLPDLAKTSTSLIGTLLTSGVARLFARDQQADLATGLELSAERGVTTHRLITSDSKQWPRLRRQLDFLSRQAGGRSLTWPKDKNMGQIFHILMGRVAGLPGAARAAIIPDDAGHDFDAVYRRFDDALDKQRFDAARTLWEEEAWRHVTGTDIDPTTLGTSRIPKERLVRQPGYDRVRAMMNVANVVYHMSCAIGAAHSMRNAPARRGEPDEVGVATALVSVFPDIVASELSAGSSVDDAKARAMNQLMISIPPDLEFGDDFSFVRSVDGDDATRECRDAHLESLQRLLRTGSISEKRRSFAMSTQVPSVG